MGIMDVFSKDDRVEMTVSQFYSLLQEAGRADLFRNGVKNKIPYEHIMAVMDGVIEDCDMGKSIPKLEYQLEQVAKETDVEDET